MIAILVTMLYIEKVVLHNARHVTVAHMMIVRLAISDIIYNLLLAHHHPAEPPVLTGFTLIVDYVKIVMPPASLVKQPEIINAYHE